MAVQPRAFPARNPGAVNMTADTLDDGDIIRVDVTAQPMAQATLAVLRSYFQTNQVVATLAALKALTTRPKSVQMAGYLTAGDKGAGPPWLWFADSVAVADDFLVVAPNVAGSQPGRWKRVPTPVVSPYWAGCGLRGLNVDDSDRFEVVKASGFPIDASDGDWPVEEQHFDADNTTCESLFSDGSGTFHLPPQTTYSISSGTYDSGTGVVTLTLASAANLEVGSVVNVFTLGGTGAFASLDGSFVTLTGTTGTTVVYNAGTGLGAATITSGSLTPAKDIFVVTKDDFHIRGLKFDLLVGGPGPALPPPCRFGIRFFSLTGGANWTAEGCAQTGGTYAIWQTGISTNLRVNKNRAYNTYGTPFEFDQADTMSVTDNWSTACGYDNNYTSCAGIRIGTSAPLRLCNGVVMTGNITRDGCGQQPGATPFQQEAYDLFSSAMVDFIGANNQALNCTSGGFEIKRQHNALITDINRRFVLDSNIVFMTTTQCSGFVFNTQTSGGAIGDTAGEYIVSNNLVTLASLAAPGGLVVGYAVAGGYWDLQFADNDALNVSYGYQLNALNSVGATIDGLVIQGGKVRSSDYCVGSSSPTTLKNVTVQAGDYECMTSGRAAFSFTNALGVIENFTISGGTKIRSVSQSILFGGQATTGLRVFGVDAISSAATAIELRNVSASMFKGGSAKGATGSVTTILTGGSSCSDITFDGMTVNAGTLDAFVFSTGTDLVVINSTVGPLAAGKRTWSASGGVTVFAANNNIGIVTSDPSGTRGGNYGDIAYNKTPTATTPFAWMVTTPGASATFTAIGGAATLAVGTTAITGGTAGRLLYEAAGNVLGETNGISWTVGGPLTITPATNQNALTLTGGTVTLSRPLITSTQTWNDAAVTFVGVSISITDTASAVGSRPFTILVGGSTVFTVLKSGSTVLGAGLSVEENSAITWSTTRTSLSAPADNQLLIRNAAGMDFDRIMLGGTTNAFVAIQRSGTTLKVRLADNSGDAPFTASTGGFSGALTATTGGFSGVVTALNATAIGAGSTAQAFVKASSTADWGIYYGTGDPGFTAPVNTLYVKKDASTAVTRLWVNVDGGTTWAFFTASA